MMTFFVLMVFTLFLAFALPCVAFVPPLTSTKLIRVRVVGAEPSSLLSMAPRYDKGTKRWSPTSSSEEESAGYSPVGSLIRFGPVPFVRRLTDPDGYNQGVLKMMANENFASRDEAQGNMDAYICNPNDWTLQKLEEKRTGVKYDYANANMSAVDLALTAAWAGVLLSVVARVVYVSQNGCDEFCQTYHW